MIVVDTHIIIWDALCPEKISSKARKAIDSANKGEGIIFCDISLWEIAMLFKKERFKIDIDYKAFINLVLNANKYTIWAITPGIAELSVYLPPAINKDPADRIIAATSVICQAPLVTADENLNTAKELTTIW
jgi:PIN domain nuclease of toxin-antitoxin system